MVYFTGFATFQYQADAGSRMVGYQVLMHRANREQ